MKFLNLAEDTGTGDQVPDEQPQEDTIYSINPRSEHFNWHLLFLVLLTTYLYFKIFSKAILPGLVSILFMICPCVIFSIAKSVIEGALQDTDGKKKSVRVQAHKCKGIQINIDDAKFTDKETGLVVKDISAELISDKVADIIASTNITKLDVKAGLDLDNFPYKGKILDKMLDTVSPGVTGVAFFAAFLIGPLDIGIAIAKPFMDKLFKNYSDFRLDRPLFSTTIRFFTEGKRWLKFQDTFSDPPLTIKFDP